MFVVSNALRDMSLSIFLGVPSPSPMPQGGISTSRSTTCFTFLSKAGEQLIVASTLWKSVFLLHLTRVSDSN